ncbi:hypothetical protein GUJ93_ZPchr0002g23654 [Zizania palustris]|uniref:General transcription factor 3C polypeptide 1 winged-helix domain-containing protein n=1 Tax=Zizania palustris TaxID=103762 RepID=A0A8J5SD62_ZIZPA|nr:hypothetical protein GUJ93_ZPchr0002g23654 [Zizania palustris]
MDELVSAALEEVCARLSPGLPVTDLWPAFRGALEASDLPLGPAVKHAPSARLIAVLVIRLTMGEGRGGGRVMGCTAGCERNPQGQLPRDVSL